MGAIITKQPNGKYARFSTVVDTFTHSDMTEEELHQLMEECHGKNDYDVMFFEVIQDMSLSNETLESAREILKEMGMHNYSNWMPSICWDDDRKEQAKWIMKELSKYMYRFNFKLIVKNGKIYLKDTAFNEEDKETGFDEVEFIFDEKNCDEPFYGTDGK